VEGGLAVQPTWFTPAVPPNGTGSGTVNATSYDCRWVAEDTEARCREDGSFPYIGCANDETADTTDCEYVVRYLSVKAFASCCKACQFGTCLEIVPTMKPTSGPKAQTSSDMQAQRWIERVWSVEWPGYIPAIKLVGSILNAKDLGVDKARSYQPKHHRHEKPIVAAAHTIQKLFKSKKATSQTSAELSPYVSERFRSEESPPRNAYVAAVAYPFKAAAGMIFLPARPASPQSDGDLSPVTVGPSDSSRRAHLTSTSTTSVHMAPTPRMLDDQSLPRPPAKRGFEKVWSK